MNTSRLFGLRLIFKKPFIALALLILLLMLNYIFFIALRTVISTAEGREQASHFDKPGTYIANLDPGSDVDFERLTNEVLKSTYAYLEDNYLYAFHVDGVIADIPNKRGFEIPVSYTNQKFDELDGFSTDHGGGLQFDYRISRGDVIPVLVGKGLAEEYPLGSQFKLNDPALEREVTVQVSGILEKDAARSNLYAYDSKDYYNFSLVVPVTEEFIRLSNIDLKLNGLNDLVILDADEPSIVALKNRIYEATGAQFNFFNHDENREYYYEYYYPSLIFVSIIALVLTVLIVAGTVWSSLVNVNLMIREFTLNRLVGLSYRNLGISFFVYYALLALVALSALYLFTLYSRLQFWSGIDPSFITFGTAGLIKMDWIAFLATALLDAVLIGALVFLVTWRIKRVPISIGVLQ